MQETECAGNSIYSKQHRTLEIYAAFTTENRSSHFLVAESSGLMMRKITLLYTDFDSMVTLEAEAGEWAQLTQGTTGPEYAIV